MKRSPMMRSSKPMKRGAGLKRGKRLGPGPKTIARMLAMKTNMVLFFGDSPLRLCQYCGSSMTMGEADLHHFTPRSELRKAGVKDLDAPTRLMAVHAGCHRVIHGGGMGRPKVSPFVDEFRVCETAGVNLLNRRVVPRLT